MTSAHSAVVIVDGEKIVQQRLVLELIAQQRSALIARLELFRRPLAFDPVRQIPVLEREVDQVRHLTPRRRSFTKSLEMDDEDIGHFPEVELF